MLMLMLYLIPWQISIFESSCSANVFPLYYVHGNAFVLFCYGPHFATCPLFVSPFTKVIRIPLLKSNRFLITFPRFNYRQFGLLHSLFCCHQPLSVCCQLFLSFLIIRRCLGSNEDSQGESCNIPLENFLFFLSVLLWGKPRSSLVVPRCLFQINV